MTSFHRPQDWTKDGLMSDEQQKVFVDALRLCIGLGPIHGACGGLDSVTRYLQTVLDGGGSQPWAGQASLFQGIHFVAR